MEQGTYLDDFCFAAPYSSYNKEIVEVHNSLFGIERFF